MLILRKFTRKQENFVQRNADGNGGKKILIRETGKTLLFTNWCVNTAEKNLKAMETRTENTAVMNVI